MIPELETLLLQWFRLEQRSDKAREVVIEAQTVFNEISHDQENVQDRIEELADDSKVDGLIIDGKHVAIIPFLNDNGVRIDILDFQEPLRKELP
jgi:hypothetical protein